MFDYRLQRLKGGWATSVYHGGKRVSRYRLEAKDAVAAAREHDALVAKLKRPVDPTVRALWEAYVEEMKGRAVVGTMEHTAKGILPHFGMLKPDQITVETCRSYVKARRPRKNGTIHTELGHLRMVLLWAKKRRLVDGEIPDIERPAKPAPAERHLTRHQFGRLLDGASGTPHIAVFCHLAIASAGRASALLELDWRRVDFERGLIFLGLPDAVRPMKGRATVPMTNALREVLLEARRNARTDYVIEYAGRPVGSVKKGLAEAGKRAGLGRVTPHMLRHSAAVWMAEDGVDMRQIAQVLGHSDVRTTERVYAVFSPNYLRGAIASLEVT